MSGERHTTRNTMEPVTTRGSRTGRNYVPARTTRANPNRHQDNPIVISQSNQPRGKYTELRKWKRMIISTCLIGICGLLILLLGCGFLYDGMQFSEEHKLTMPLIMCVLAIVIGSLMLIGSIIVSRLLCSKQWRNQDAHELTQYSRNHTSQDQRRTVNTQQTTNSRPSRNSTTVEEPPPYEYHSDLSNQDPHIVFHIPDNYCNLPLEITRTDNYTLPAYTELREYSPPCYTEVADPKSGPGMIPNDSGTTVIGSLRANFETSDVNTNSPPAFQSLGVSNMDRQQPNYSTIVVQGHTPGVAGNGEQQDVSTSISYDDTYM